VDPNITEPGSDRFQANRFDIVSRLADDLAHEIKNPLNSIVINLEVLKVRITRGDVEGATGRTAVIEEEVRRLHLLIDRILLLLRPESFEASNLPVDSALSEIVPLVEAQARLARNRFTSECESTVLVPVRRDLFKFALLSLFIAVHDRLGEGGGEMKLHCTAGERDVTLVIEARPLDGAVLVEGAVEGMRDAAALAETMLAPSGASIEVSEDRVTLVMPRAPSM
jgi:signal transduction histidine kinase